MSHHGRHGGAGLCTVPSQRVVFWVQTSRAGRAFPVLEFVHSPPPPQLCGLPPGAPAFFHGADTCRLIGVSKCPSVWRCRLVLMDGCCTTTFCIVRTVVDIFCVFCQRGMLLCVTPHVPDWELCPTSLWYFRRLITFLRRVLSYISFTVDSNSGDYSCRIFTDPLAAPHLWLWMHT